MTAGADRGDRARVRRAARGGQGRPRRPRRRLHPRHHRAAPAARADRPRRCWWRARFRPAWVLGTATLSLAKILENMEIGHNVLHGQWDWMNDPVINSSAWDWDTASTSEAWKHSHNYIHHTYTNIRGKDRDLGYEIMRIDPHQPWHPVYLLQPLYNVLLMALFEWGVALHDLDMDAIRSGEKSPRSSWSRSQGHPRQGAHADPEGLRRLAGVQRGDLHRRALPRAARRARRQGRVQAGVPGHADRRRRGQRHPQPVVARDHLLRPLPRPDVHVHRRRRPRTRAAGRATSAS